MIALVSMLSPLRHFCYVSICWGSEVSIFLHSVFLCVNRPHLISLLHFHILVKTHFAHLCTNMKYVVFGTHYMCCYTKLILPDVGGFSLFQSKLPVFLGLGAPTTWRRVTSVCENRLLLILLHVKAVRFIKLAESQSEKERPCER